MLPPLRRIAAPLAIFFSLFLVACGDTVESSDLNLSLLPTGPGIRDFYSTMTDLEVEVAYEPGAEPSAGNSSRGYAYWSILESNLKSAFAPRAVKPTLHVPKVLAEMNAIPAQAKSSWTAQEILDLSYKHRKGGSSYTTGNFWIVFLNGNFHHNGAADPSIIGIQVNRTTVIAIFKDVVRTTGSSKGSVSFAEQSTVVHEMGHALGLVDNGVPMVSAHHDDDHPHHCSNPDCVMYWENEGSNNLRKFVQRAMLTGNTDLFGPECLDDMAAYRPE